MRTHFYYCYTKENRTIIWITPSLARKRIAAYYPDADHCMTLLDGLDGEVIVLPDFVIGATKEAILTWKGRTL